MRSYHLLILFILNLFGFVSHAQDWYKMPVATETRWASFENPTAEKGMGGSENKNAKGHPSEMLTNIIEEPKLLIFQYL